MNSILQRNYRIDFLDLFFNDRFHRPQLLSLLTFLDFLIHIAITLYLKIIFIFSLSAQFQKARKSYIKETYKNHYEV